MKRFIILIVLLSAASGLFAESVDVEQVLKEKVVVLIDYIENAVDFTIAEAPNFIQQAMEFWAWRAKLWIIVSAIPIALLLLFGIFCIMYGYHAEDSEWFGVSALSFAVAVLVSLFTITNLVTFYQIKLAPGLFLIEKLSELF